MSNAEKIMKYLEEAKKYKYPKTLIEYDLNNITGSIYNDGYQKGYNDCVTSYEMPDDWIK